MSCMVTKLPVRFFDAPADTPVLDYLRTSFRSHESSVTVLVEGFDIEGDGAEAALMPAQGNRCLLSIEPTDPEAWEPFQNTDTIRFYIEASPIFDSQPLPDIYFLEAERNAIGDWEWFLSCDGAPNCVRCTAELALCA